MKQCVVESGYETDPLQHETHRTFASFVMAGNVHLLNPEPTLPPETPALELGEARQVLRKINEQANVVALWLHGQPPKSRQAVLAGFAAAKGIPIAALRSQTDTTGEGGLRFNLMLHAAIETSLGTADAGWEEPFQVARTYPELTKLVGRASLLDRRAISSAKPPVPKRGEKLTCYPASPYGFADSTRGFYATEVLPLLRRIAHVADPWVDAEIEVGLALTESPERVARAWTAVGVSHIKRIMERCHFVVAYLDQEPPDTGTLVEVGVAAACGKPVILYRNDLRICSEGTAKLDAMTQAAATLHLPVNEAVRRVDAFATNLDEMAAQVGRVVERLQLPRTI